MNHVSKVPRLTAEHIVIIVFASLGFFGCVYLQVWTRAAPILVSFFLATGIAALVYGFSGGISGASFTIGALKLSGTLAALVGVAFAVNHVLVDQLPFRLVSDEAMVGEWRWVYAAEGWEGHLVFSKDKGHLIFVGQESKWINGKLEPLLDLTNGKARFIERSCRTTKSKLSKRLSAKT